MNWNIFKTTFQICKNSTMVQGVPISMVLISWFWFTGNLLANQLPAIAKLANIPSNMYALCFITITIGVTSGAVLCKK